MKFNTERMLQTTKELFDAKRNKTGIFSEGICDPADDLPLTLFEKSPNYKKNYSHYLFYMSGTTYRENSTRTFKGGRELYEDYPFFFDPKTVVKTKSVEDCQTIVRDYLKHGFYKIIGERWYENSKILVEKYDGNVVNLFNDTIDVNVVHRRVRNKTLKNQKQGFRGFGDKVSNLFIGYIHRHIHPFQNTYDLKRPVDVHDMRIFLGQEIIDLEGEIPNHEKMEKFIMMNTYKFFKEHLEFDPTYHKLNTWILGSYGCINREKDESRIGNKYRKVKEIESDEKQIQLVENNIITPKYTKSKKISKNRPLIKCRQYCPFSRPCTSTLDQDGYRYEGKIIPIKKDLMLL